MGFAVAATREMRKSALTVTMEVAAPAIERCRALSVRPAQEHYVPLRPYMAGNACGSSTDPRGRQ